ncbi:MAG: uncharacterized protein KVP18_001828 [Porospora cf. gigantea A]|uniref:uncharacterized protein n=1 Tax=Porospora cf. gigantea A TaxID=2853593 RepID=UPI00355A3201|nr:MAG: hypothetical protein KVP18_001828 [Porospora cf. gigantea A]
MLGPRLRTLVFSEAKVDLGRISGQLQPTAQNATQHGGNDLLTPELTDVAEVVQDAVRELQDAH